MDYATSYVFYCVLLLLVTLALVSMSMAHPTVVGGRWMLGAAALEFGKTLLQGMDGHVSRYVSGMLANELNLLAFCAMYLGYRWFVLRRPLRSALPMAAVVIMLGVYAAMFQQHWRFGFQVQGAMVIWICGCAAMLLLRQTEPRYVIPGRVAGGLLLLQIGALGYRMAVALSRDHYHAKPGTAWADPRWMYSMLVLMWVGACLLGTYIWLTAVEMTAVAAELAERDVVTGAWTRQAMMRTASELVGRSLREGRPLAMVALAVDEFERMNDRLGSEVGDAILRSVAKAAGQRMRATDGIARISSEGFLLLLPDMDGSRAADVAERVRADVEALRVVYGGGLHPVTVSAGATQMADHHDTVAAMMTRADRALGRATSAGRNRVVFDEGTELVPKRPVLVVNGPVRRQPQRPYLVQ